LRVGNEHGGAAHGTTVRVSPPISNEVVRLVRSLFEERSLLDRLRGLDHRIASLAQIAGSREVRVVPDLLPLLTADDALAPHVARTIAELVRDVTPVQLSWLDEQVRHSSYAYYWRGAWHKLAPAAVSRLAQAADLDPMVIGLLASHANGFVRAAALEVLAPRLGGQEIPFLSLRANDWVEPVAARASELLTSRLRPDNRYAVLNALPFILRVLRQRRHDHIEVERALRTVLLSDGGEDALARGPGLATPVRRMMYELLTSGGTAVQHRLIDAALSDSDAGIRARAIRSVATDADFEHRAAILEWILRDDPVPAVRRLVLAVLSEHMPQRIAGVFPDVLLDRAASVRGLARFVASTHQLALVPREVYVQGLAGNVPGQLGAAIEGVGETGTPADADLLASFLRGNRPRIRRSALRALAKLDAERAISSAIAALADDASSVRSAAVDILSTNANRVDFEIVSRRVRSLSDPHARRNLLRVFVDAPKWEAPVFLLEALTDPDDAVRTFASRLIERWMENFNRNQTQPTAKQLHRIGALLDSAENDQHVLVRHQQRRTRQTLRERARHFVDCRWPGEPLETARGDHIAFVGAKDHVQLIAGGAPRDSVREAERAHIGEYLCPSKQPCV
jgi:HEAT repeat protein